MSRGLGELAEPYPTLGSKRGKKEGEDDVLGILMHCEGAF